jgi:hypothetical protein
MDADNDEENEDQDEEDQYQDQSDRNDELDAEKIVEIREAEEENSVDLGEDVGTQRGLKIRSEAERAHNDALEEQKAHGQAEATA